MMSKWEWIEKACIVNGFSESAEIARKIEGILKDLYGNTVTDMWESELGSDIIPSIKSSSSFYIRFVLLRPEFCIACDRESGDCDSCKFGLLTGRCGTSYSLFCKFRDTFFLEMEKENET